MSKTKSLPPTNLEKYLKGRKHNYITCEEGARRLGMPYWSFVRMSREVGATWALRKNCMVDIDVVEKYIEEKAINK